MEAVEKHLNLVHVGQDTRLDDDRGSVVFQISTAIEHLHSIDREVNIIIKPYIYDDLPSAQHRYWP